MAIEKVYITLNHKQMQAHRLMSDNVTKYIFYGGAVGGGKSFFLDFDAVNVCMGYPGARCLVSREQYCDFKITTYNTLLEVLSILKLKNGIDYTINMTNKVIQFNNGSQIVFPPLGYVPKDPEYTKIGGLELTRAYVDEAVQITKKLFEVLKSRVGRCKATNGIVSPKIFLASNPFKCWINDVFVRRHKEGTLPYDFAYIFANYKDNASNLPQTYIDSILGIEDEITRSRLVDGNWDYDDSQNKIFDYQSLMSIFDDVNVDIVKQGVKYMTIDVARFGKDLSVIGIWQGNYLYHIESIKYNSIVDLYNIVVELQKEHSIETSHIVADQDGVGGGLVDFLNCFGFVNNSVAENYQNLKTKCIFDTAGLINSGSLFIKDCIYKEQIISEFDKYRKIETNDGKLKCTDKKTLKVLLGSSPDYSDMIIMRRFFDELEHKSKTSIYIAEAESGEYEVSNEW